MSDTVSLRGAGGSIYTFDLPLPDVYAEQVVKGKLQAVSPDDSKALAYLYGDVSEPDGQDDGGLPAGNASREAWAAAADDVGVTYSDDDGRNDIRDAVKASL